MSFQKKINKRIKVRAKRRTFRVRNKQVSRGDKPRISVYRSLSNIFAQIIDDKTQNTLTSFSSLKLNDKSGDKKAIAKKVGIELGKKAVEQGVKSVFFDRGKYLYHGRVKALADGLRESGLSF